MKKKQIETMTRIANSPYYNELWFKPIYELVNRLPEVSVQTVHAFMEYWDGNQEPIKNGFIYDGDVVFTSETIMVQYLIFMEENYNNQFVDEWEKRYNRLKEEHEQLKKQKKRIQTLCQKVTL